MLHAAEEGWVAFIEGCLNGPDALTSLLLCAGQPAAEPGGAVVSADTISAQSDTQSQAAHPRQQCSTRYARSECLDICPCALIPGKPGKCYYETPCDSYGLRLQFPCKAVTDSNMDAGIMDWANPPEVLTFL